MQFIFSDGKDQVTYQVDGYCETKTGTDILGPGRGDRLSLSLRYSLFDECIKQEAAAAHRLRLDPQAVQELDAFWKQDEAPPSRPPFVPRLVVDNGLPPA